MAKRMVSRRNFLKNVGISASAALLANAGLPLVAARDTRAFAQTLNQARRLSELQAQLAVPDVELLVGDVVGFALSSSEWEAAFGWVTFHMHKAWYDGEDVYYIRTDASDAEFAANNKLVHVPLLAAATAAEGATSQLYTFANGSDDQYPVVSTIPANENYSSAWQIHIVTFNSDPGVLTSVDEIMAAADAGDVSIEGTPIVVNFPLVKWPGGELPEDTAKDSYLGTGPLVSPVNVDHMHVTFKLHECFPGSRYIVTDTSAVPMAPMMAIAPSGPTQALVGVGATDEIWVFANGIPGSGVMGFQPAIFDHSAGNPIWSPFWDHYTVEWADESAARVLTNSDEIRELIDSGALDLYAGTPATDPTGFVVNCPVPIKAANEHRGGSMM